MQAFFSSEGSYALQFLVIFLVILVLFLVAAMLFMRLSGRGLSLAASPGQRGRQPRLGIVDIYELDRQRQLILLRRDNVEHLLLVGGPNDVVIERHIQRGAGSRYAPEGSGRSESGAAEAGALEPPRTDPFLDSPAPPTFTMPEVVSASAPSAQPAADRTPSLDPGLFEPEISPADARPRPASPVSRLMRRTAPTVVGPRAETASERAARPDPVPPPPTPPGPASEPPPVIAGREPRVVDPAVLSDMARQLQVALKRPSSAVTPPPGAPVAPPPPPPAPKPAEPTPPTQPDPVAAAMATAQPEPPSPAAPPARQETQAAPAAAPPRTEPRPAAAPKPAAPTGAGSSRSEAAEPEPKAESAESGGQGQNPFSVEEIEAEFARLLGRPLDSKG
ncbi:MAG: hypothetical protein PGN25_17390 [Methylorubrum populi]